MQSYVPFCFRYLLQRLTGHVSDVFSDCLLVFVYPFPKSQEHVEICSNVSKGDVSLGLMSLDLGSFETIESEHASIKELIIS